MRMFKKKLLLTCLFIFILSVSSFAMDNAKLLRSPDIHGENIVFVYAGDLWTCSIIGGDAVRLTTHPGYENSPRFSPDGQFIAFSAQYDGNTDIFIIPARGGEPKRITYHPGVDMYPSFSSDGKSIVFTSNRENFSRTSRLFKIGVDGVFPERLPFPKGLNGSYSPDNSHIAYSPLSSNVFRAWRRYRGGTAPYIWIYNFADQSVVEIPRTDSNDVFPIWVKDKIYFLSDRDRVMNLYSYHHQSKELKQLTMFKGSDIKTFGADDNNIVFEKDGILHLKAAGQNETKPLSINIPNEQLNRRPHFVKASRHINSMEISPTGKRAAFEARGEILTVPAKKGDVRNLTRTPGKMERNPVWSPDGKWVAYFGEENKEYALKIVDQKGIKAPMVYTFKDPTFFYSLKWSPDSKKLAFNDLKQNLYWIDFSSGKTTLIDSEPEFLRYPEPSWSPDSKWIVYDKSAENGLSTLFLYNLESGKKHQITDSMGSVSNAVFDKNGKYLYFTASTDIALDTAWLDMSSYPHNPTNSIYLMVLSKDEPSPFKPDSDEEEVKEKKPAAEKTKNDKKEGKKTPEKTVVTRIDIDGLKGRIVAIDIDKGRYSDLQAGSEGSLYYMSRKAESRDSALHMYDIKKQKDATLIEKLNGYVISADGKKMLFSQRSAFTICDAGKKPAPGKGLLKTSSIETWSDPELEYAQMLYEAWRINRDYFYDPDMHGHDWQSVWKQYEPFLPYVSHRSDLSYLIDMMIGEYTCGHARNSGGMYPDVNRVSGGLLGADYEIKDGFYFIKKIYQGENWNPDLRSPLTEPGIDISEGSYLVEVNGVKLNGKMNLYSLFQKTAGKQVRIKINSSPSLEDAREFVVVPLSSEYMLRHRQWIDENRKMVDKLSDGKAGYVYMPNTSVGGFNYFNRYYFAQLNKPVMVLDERFNGGGFVADYIINMMNRSFMSWWQPRYGKPFMSPNNAHFGPKVMLINEHAGSGGDFMPWAFKEAGLGKLVGKRTWGGLVGISGYPSLMDGGYVTAPSFGIVSKDGEFIIENVGVAPDIEVEITPKDFINGRDPQLEAAVKTVLEELKNKPALKYKHNGFPRGR